MTDEIEQDPTVEDRLSSGTDAHAADPHEDPEDHVGKEIPDPWEDSSQMDWPNEVVELDGGQTATEV